MASLLAHAHAGNARDPHSQTAASAASLHGTAIRGREGHEGLACGQVTSPCAAVRGRASPSGRRRARTQGLDRLELIRFLQVAQTLTVHHGALAYLLGINALRASEAAAVRIEDYQETLRGHRVLHLVGKGNKPAAMPLTVPVLRVLEACRGQRTCRAEGSFFAPPGISSSSSWCSCESIWVGPRPAVGDGQPGPAGPRAARRRPPDADSSSVPISATEWASIASVLRPWPVAKTLVRADGLGGTFVWTTTTERPAPHQRRVRTEPAGSGAPTERSPWSTTSSWSIPQLLYAVSAWVPSGLR